MALTLPTRIAYDKSVSSGVAGITVAFTLYESTFVAIQAVRYFKFLSKLLL